MHVIVPNVLHGHDSTFFEKNIIRTKCEDILLPASLSCLKKDIITTARNEGTRKREEISAKFLP